MKKKATKKAVKKVVVKKKLEPKVDFKARAKEMDVLVKRNLAKAREATGLSDQDFDALWMKIGVAAIGLPNHSGIYLLQAGVRCLQGSEAQCADMGITKELSTPF